MDFSEMLEEEPVVEVVRPAPKPIVLPPKSQYAMLRSIEDELNLDAVDKLRGASFFSKIDPEETTPPRDWVKEIGKKAAEERLRLAKMALMPKKDVPYGLMLAESTHAGIVKARAIEKTGPRTLNMMLVQMPAAAVDYPRLEVEERK